MRIQQVLRIEYIVAHFNSKFKSKRNQENRQDVKNTVNILYLHHEMEKKSSTDWRCTLIIAIDYYMVDGMGNFVHCNILVLYQYINI